MSQKMQSGTSRVWPSCGAGRDVNSVLPSPPSVAEMRYNFPRCGIRPGDTSHTVSTTTNGVALTDLVHGRPVARSGERGCANESGARHLGARRRSRLLARVRRRRRGGSVHGDRGARQPEDARRRRRPGGPHGAAHDRGAPRARPAARWRRRSRSATRPRRARCRSRSTACRSTCSSSTGSTRTCPTTASSAPRSGRRCTPRRGWCRTTPRCASRPRTSGSRPVEHHPVGRRGQSPAIAGWTTLEADHDDDRRRSTPPAPCRPTTADRAGDALHENEFAVLRNGSQCALVRCASTTSCVLLPHAAPEAWGLRARSKEQRFALELLLDPDVSVVALDGRAGTGKTLLAIAAGLEQVVEQRALREASPSTGRSCRSVAPTSGFLPGGLDEKLDPWMSAIHDAIVALTDQRSAARRAAAGRRADRSQPAVARVGDVPARSQPAPPDRRGRRGPEPGAHHAQDGAHPHRRGHEGDLHRRHQPDRRARTSASRTTRWPC